MAKIPEVDKYLPIYLKKNLPDRDFFFKVRTLDIHCPLGCRYDHANLAEGVD